jgi:vacuolar protein sorting-associated protein 41
LQGTAQRPEIHLVSWKNDELTTYALPIDGYEHYKEKYYAVAHAPFKVCLIVL